MYIIWRWDEDWIDILIGGIVGYAKEQVYERLFRRM